MEEVPNTFPALFTGYTVLWVIFCCYLFVLIFKLRKIQKGIDRLKDD